MTEPAAGSALLGPSDVRALAARLGTCAHQAARPELRHRRQHGPAHRPDRRPRPDDRVLEVGPGLGSLTLGLLPRRVGGRGRDRAGAGAEPAAHGRGSRPGLVAASTVVEADALRVTDRARAGRRRRSSPTCPTTSPCRCCCTCGSCSRPSPDAGHGPGRGRRPAGCRPGQPRLRRPVGEGPLVRRRPEAGAVGRTVFWPAPNVDSGLVAVDHRPPPDTRASTAARSSPQSTRPSRSGARRCGPPSRRGRVRRRRPRRRSAQAGIDPGAAWRAAEP